MAAGIHEKRNQPVVGLMGGICSGKTTVADIFEKRGFVKIDADRIVFSLHETPEVKAQIQQEFGGKVFSINGSVDKKALADIAFSEKQRLKDLHAIMHPPVIREIERLLAETDYPVVLDAALLVETQLDVKFCTDLVFVHRPLIIRQKCAAEKRGWDRNELLRRESMQLPLGQKEKKADYFINNSASYNELMHKTNNIIKKIYSKYSI